MSESRSAAAPARPVARAVTVTELAAFFALLVSYIWLWQGAFAWHRILVVALYAAIGAETHWRRRESLRDIGIRLDNLAAFARLATLWLGPVIAAGLAIGLARGGWDLPSPLVLVLSLLWSLTWGTAQEYGLVCVFYRRLRDLLPARDAALAAGVIFSLLHLPNPLLMGITLVLGVLGCYLYEREPNLIGLGIAHGLISFVLANSLPTSLTFGWMVGPHILPRVLPLF